MDEPILAKIFCVWCSANEHHRCENRQEILGAARTLAVAIYGQDVTDCCCGAPE